MSKSATVETFVLAETTKEVPITQHAARVDGRSIRRGIEAWFNGGVLETSTQGEIYTRLIAAQTQLGWRQIFSGRFSLIWAELQQDHLSRVTDDQNAGLEWTVKIITFIWEEWHELWTSRNGEIHGHDYTTRQRAREKIAEARLTAIYEQRQDMRPAERELLYDNVQEHMRERSTNQVLDWLSVYTPTFRYSIAEARRAAITGVRSIRDYFQPADA